MLKNLFTLFFILLIVSCDDNDLINPADSLTGVPVMDIYVEQDDYENMLANKGTGKETPCRIFFEGETYLGNIEASGAGSRYHHKWAYSIELADGTIDDLEEIKLSAQTFDPTLLKTTITSYLYRKAGFQVFKNRHVFLRINNVNQGLYPLIEDVEKKFFEIRNLPVYELYKTGFEAKFTFTENNYPQFNFKKEIPEDENFNSLREFIYTIDTCSVNKVEKSLKQHLDIQNYLRYHALTSIINNSDAFANNFFLWKKNPLSPFTILPWDFDKTFDMINVFEGIAGKNEIIDKLLKNPEVKAMYYHEITLILNDIFNLEKINTIIDSTAGLIREAYNLDPYLGYGGRYNLDDEILKLEAFAKQRWDFFNEQVLLNNN